MVSYVTFSVLCIWITGFVAIGSALPWVHPSLEALDEVHDAEIYKAVVTSMNEWKKKQEQKKTNRVKREDIPIACFKDLGCFEASGPFGYLDTLPDKPEDIATKFLMFPGRRRRKRGSPPAEVPFEKLDEAFVWAKEGFNGSLPTKVLVHGFGSDCNYIWIYEIRSALMAVEEVNIICVDWSNGAALPNYVKASANTRLVGKQLSLLLRGLVEKNGLSLRKTHIIGFSLGAHIAAFAGADLGNLSRITGLDPAGPLFESQDPRARLDQSDAEFVDVIHSNGENLILGGLGSSQPMGHVDFYPNGGRMQKGCSHLFVGAVSDIIWSSAVEGRSLCNHRRAYKFFIDSVSPRCHFPAFPCDSYESFLDGNCFPCTDERQCGNMGYYADRSKGKGQLYLITRDEEPFCAHQYVVKLESSPSPIPVKSYGKIQITLIGESALNETFVVTKIDDEELKLGASISKILVPHPILGQPAQIEIRYTAYSGWLSSGLTQWSMNKITLMDSFGKTSSVCKKNLILESGVPVLLPLYPGECNVPKQNFEDEAEDRIQTADDENITSNSIKRSNNFIPTQVVKVGLDDKEYKTTEKSGISFKNAMDFFNIPWSDNGENDVIDEAESSRAFNNKIIKTGPSNKTSPVKEIVEPILKKPSNKNARSHDPDKEKEVEITEPILGPTSEKNVLKVTKKEQNPKNISNQKESEWVPREPTKKEQKKRQDESRIMSGFEPPNLGDPLEAIVSTVQFLPQRLARMFDQAERYARETILPLVSNYTPRFITDIIVPKESSTQKYVPLRFEESSSKIVTTTISNEERNKINKKFDPPPSSLNVETPPSTSEFTTPFTNIQKIKKKGDVEEVLPEKLALIQSVRTEKDELVAAGSENHQRSAVTEKPVPVSKDVKRRARDDLNVQRSNSINPFESIINTVQVIPENIGKMIQNAEKFAKNNVLPFVANLTPKFLTDIFNPKQKDLPQYIPFTSEELVQDIEDIEDKRSEKSGRSRRNQHTETPVMFKDESEDDDKENSTTSNIQKIPKKKRSR